MKKSITFFFVYFVLVAAVAYPLARAERLPGFEMNPQHKTIFIDSSGAVTEWVLNYNSQKTRIEKLGTLSAYALKQIRRDIKQIKAGDNLIDANEGGPICMDAPATLVDIYIGGKIKTIYKQQNCHEWRLDSYFGYKTIEFSKGFLEL